MLVDKQRHNLGEFGTAQTMDGWKPTSSTLSDTSVLGSDTRLNRVFEQGTCIHHVTRP